VIGRHAALRDFPPEGLRRVADRPTQAMKAKVLEVLARPVQRLAGPQVAPLALDTQATQPSDDEAVRCDELPSGIARTEVLAPTPQHGVKVADDFADIRVAS
jgi:hypothetical protein